MFFYIVLWLLSGLIALAISRLIVQRVEKILGYESNFLNLKFFKDNSHRVFYGPIYLISVLWNSILNLDIFSKARKLKKLKEDQDAKLANFTAKMELLGQQMLQMYKSMSSLENSNEEFEEFETMETKEEPTDALKDVEDMLKDFNDDEEEE